MSDIYKKDKTSANTDVIEHDVEICNDKNPNQLSTQPDKTGTKRNATF